jgi:hypothetical protein
MALLMLCQKPCQQFLINPVLIQPQSGSGNVKAIKETGVIRLKVNVGFQDKDRPEIVLGTRVQALQGAIEERVGGMRGKIGFARHGIGVPFMHEPPPQINFSMA